MGSVNFDLFNSSYCRLCCVDSGQNGVFIFSSNTPENISNHINKYLPIIVSDDGSFPRTICSNCHVKLLSTISFYELVAEGQKKLFKLAEPEEYSPQPNEKYEVHQKKRSGRPKKNNLFQNLESISVLTTDDNTTVPTSSKQPVRNSPKHEKSTSLEDKSEKSKRKRKLPSRFNSLVQGKELEKVYREVGLPEDEAEAISFSGEASEPSVIGKVETNEGEDLGIVMVQSAKEESVRLQMKYCCDACDKIFIQERKFLDHQLSHTTKVDESQSVPPKGLKKNSPQDKVKTTRLEKESLSCNLCHKKYKTISSLLYHKETAHSDGRRYICNKCPRAFKHRQLLRRHQLVHSTIRSHLCEQCGAGFKSKGNLLNHMLRHTGVKKYICEICGHGYSHKTSLLLHMRWHNGEKPFECDYCKKRFTQKGNLQEHLRIHTGEKPYECSSCGRTFTTSSQIKLHMKRHTGERPFFCNFCHKSFLSKASWKCHLRRHKGEKPYECKSCNRSFSEIWALKKHTRTHTGEKPYVCATCGKAFSDCSNLTKHKKSHQKEKISEEDVETEQVVYLSYTDPMNPSSEVSEKFILENKAEQNEEVILQVVDELGNPMKFTLQDGTQLEVTSDGRTLEVRTPDGQTIPVGLTDSSGKSVDPVLTPVVIPNMADMTDSLVEISAIELVSNEEEPHTLALPSDFLQIV